MRLLILYLLTVSILSCQPSAEPCRNEQLLQKPYGDSLPVFELSAGMPALGNFLDSIYAIQVQYPDSLIQFYLKDSLFTPCSFDPSKIELNGQIICYSYRHIFEVLVNSHAQLLVEGELVKIDSLGVLWKKNVLNHGIDPELAVNPQRSLLKIKFSMQTTTDTVTKILSALHQTQNEILMEEVRSNFAVPFCDIETDSIYSILDKYPLKIFISWKEDDFPELPIVPVPKGL